MNIINLCTKYTVLSVTSSLSYSLWILLNLLYVLPVFQGPSGSYFAVLLVSPILNSVALVDVVCIALSYKIAEHFYTLCCARCDALCRMWCKQ